MFPFAGSASRFSCLVCFRLCLCVFICFCCNCVVGLLSSVLKREKHFFLEGEQNSQRKFSSEFFTQMSEVFLHTHGGVNSKKGCFGRNLIHQSTFRNTNVVLALSSQFSILLLRNPKRNANVILPLSFQFKLRNPPRGGGYFRKFWIGVCRQGS